MFATSIFCDKCGCEFFSYSIETKKFMVNTAREKGWSIGNRHLCPNCREKRKGRAGRCEAAHGSTGTN